MDKMSIWSILLVSFPEELLTVIIILTATGFKDVLNFKQKNNIIKLLFTSTLMVFTAIACRSFMPTATASFILQSVVFYLIIVSIYKYRVFACIPSFLMSAAVIIVSEALFVSPIIKLLDLSLQTVYSNDFIRVLVFLPDRISQIIVIMIICKLRNISMQVSKPNREQLIPIIFYCLMVISSMISIESSLKSPIKDFSAVFKLFINIGIAITFTTWTIYMFFKLRKKMLIKDNIHDIELHHIKQLLEEGKSGYALELINLTLDEKGYYKNQYTKQ